MTAPRQDPAFVIVNARVWTGDPRRPWADAVLVRGDRIEAVGSSAELRKRIGAGVRQVDAARRTVVPGAVAAGGEGALRAGERADLALLDRDLPRVTPDTVAGARVVLSISAGAVVVDREGLLSDAAETAPLHPAAREEGP